MLQDALREREDKLAAAHAEMASLRERPGGWKGGGWGGVRGLVLVFFFVFSGFFLHFFALLLVV